MKQTTPEQILSIPTSLGILWPEVLLCLGVFVLIIFSLFRRFSPNVAGLFSVALLITYMVILAQFYWPDTPVSLFDGMLRTDDFSAVFRMLICCGAILTFLMTEWKTQKIEYFLLIITVVAGSCFLVMSTNMIMIVLGLEIISISSYVLTAGFQPDKRRSEAAWKFFLFGSAATAFMIFGMSYVFGFSGTLDFSSSLFFDQLVRENSGLLIIGSLMALGGLLFKITAVPFHFWAPDVYESAPTPIVAFFSVVPKIAGFGILIKFTLALNLFGQSVISWPLVLGIISMASILVGNLAALSQKDAKRMMAYSSVAQSGFILIALCVFSIGGIHLAVFYVTVFMIMNFLTFHIIHVAEKGLQTTDMQAFEGWGYRHVFLASALVIALVSQVGLPPTAGFMAKLFLFSALWNKYQETGQYFFALLFAVGLINSVISLFFYLRLPYFMFIKRPVSAVYPIKSDWPGNLLALILVTLLILLFFYPSVLMGWANKINFVL